ncbi:MAG: outer membrane protein assembly factor BamE [Acidobacteriota bacterium]
MTLNLTRRALIALAPVALLAGCANSGQSVSLSKPETLFGLIEPYKVDVVQGNVVTQEFISQIQPGFGRMQVREILGTPLLTDIFHNDRWDYVFTIRRQGVPDQKRRVTIYFKNDAVDHFDAETLPQEREFVASIDRQKDLKPAVPNLTEEQIAALPVPAKADTAPPKVPQGAVRTYPPLESAQP